MVRPEQLCLGRAFFIGKDSEESLSYRNRYSGIGKNSKKERKDEHK